MLDEAERSLHDALCVLSQTVRDSRVVLGGGWCEMQMARVVDDLAATTPGKRSLAMAAYGRALRQIPTIICDNAGLDSAEIVSQMRAGHAADPAGTTAGVDVLTGAVGDMKQVRGRRGEGAAGGGGAGAGRRAAWRGRLLGGSAACPGLTSSFIQPCLPPPSTPPSPPAFQRGIYEAFKVKSAALMSATEAAEMILRVDDIIKAAPRQRQG